MIDDKLWFEIKEYCEANDIDNVDELVNEMLKRGFTIEKFGDALNTIQLEPEIKEVVKEVPVEVEVEKEIIVTDNEEIDKLANELNDKRKEIADLEEQQILKNREIADLEEKMILKDREIKKLKDEIERLKSKRDFYGEI